MLEDILVLLIIGLLIKKLNFVTGALCILVLYVYIRDKLNNKLKFHIVNDENGMNESIILEAKLNNKYDTLFMLDTGYAGPPVLSATYLSIQDKCRRGTILQRYRSSLKYIKGGVSDDERHRAIDLLLQDGQCQAFTSGCTMKLVGIGSIVEQQADMLLCPMVSFKNCFGIFVNSKNSNKVNADVLVTNPLPSNVNILTCDYLTHSLPTMIDMYNKNLCLNMSNIQTMAIENTFSKVPIKLVGGAFVVPIKIGDINIEVTVDTGAPGPVCLGKNAASKIKKYWKGETPRKITQKGVNGEKICSNILFSCLEIAGIEFEEVGVFLNDRDIDDVDGYVGLSVLKSLDILMLPTSIGFRKSGIPPKTDFSFASKGECKLE